MNRNRNLLSFVFVLALVSVFASCQKKATLSLWNKDAPSRIELESYLSCVCKKGSPDFIPVERRIAVFDFDGTLYGERDPFYLDFLFFAHRILKDETYRERATAEQIELAEKIIAVKDTRAIPEEIEHNQGDFYMTVFKNMSLNQFEKSLEDYLDEYSPGYIGLKRADSFFLPMLQVVDVLIDHKFTVYICSGTERTIIRTVGKKHLPLPMRNYLGSDYEILSTGQGSTSSLDYVFKKGDVLINGERSISFNLKMNKVSLIAQEIGEQPVLAFGNSSGDESMVNYTISGNEYKSLAFMLLCDDTVREYGDEAKAESMRKSCEENGWVPISMKNDWKTIYGEGVTRRD